MEEQHYNDVERRLDDLESRIDKLEEAENARMERLLHETESNIRELERKIGDFGFAARLQSLINQCQNGRMYN